MSIAFTAWLEQSRATLHVSVGAAVGAAGGRAVGRAVGRVVGRAVGRAVGAVASMLHVGPLHWSRHLQTHVS